MVGKILHTFFIPNENNNFRAKALHIDVLTLYLIVIVAITLSFSRLQLYVGDVLGYATDITVEKLLQYTNEERSKANLSPLSYSQKLSQSASKKAQDMFAKNYWSHYAPNGLTPWDFILASGYQYEYAGENLAKNFLFSKGVVDAWMNSITHKENILKKDYTDVGFGVINGVLNGEPTTLVVQMFGRPTVNPLAKQEQKEPPNPPQKNLASKNLSSQTQTTVLAKSSSQGKKSLITISLNSSIVFLTFLAIALTMDFYFAVKLKIIRIGGKNLAHLIFIGFIWFGLFIFTKGAIL